jgi:hypothetical protein
MLKTAAILASALAAPVLAASHAAAGDIRVIPPALCADHGGASSSSISSMLRTRNPIVVTTIDCPLVIENPNARAVRIQVAVMDTNPGALSDDDVVCQAFVFNRFGTRVQAGSTVRTRGVTEGEGTLLTIPVPTMLPGGGYSIRCKLPRLNAVVGSGMGPIRIEEEAE